MAKIFEKNNDGTYVFGEGEIKGWSFESTLPNPQKERTVRNAILAVLNHQASGNHEMARKILNLQVNGDTVCGAIVGTLTRYAAGGIVQAAAAKAAKEVREEASRTVGQAPRNGTSSIDQVSSLIEDLATKHGYRPKMVEHHQNGNPARVWVWTSPEDSTKILSWIGAEDIGNNRRLILDPRNGYKLPQWATSAGRPEYVEHEAYGDDPSMGSQIEEGLRDRERAVSRGTYDPNSGTYSKERKGNRNPYKAGESWIKRTLGEKISIGTARNGKNGTKACELCLDPIKGGEMFIKGTTGAKRAHKLCFEERAKHVHA